MVAATLAAGLRTYSRCMMRIAGERLTLTESLLALLVDKVAILCWQNTEDGQRGRNLPESIYKALTEEKEEYKGFASGQDFMDEWRKL